MVILKGVVRHYTQPSAKSTMNVYFFEGTVQRMVIAVDYKAILQKIMWERF